MQLAYRLVHRLFLPVLVLLIVISLPRCSKNNNPNNKMDSTDTLPKKVVYDSAAFYVSFLINVYNTSGVYQDTFSDNASMKIYIVNGKITMDSILNFPPIVFPASGSDNLYTAVWIPDDIGVINITGATGLALVDTLVAISLTQTGTVTPNWKLIAKMGGTTTTSGNTPTPGWPAGFTFNPKLKSQDAFKLEQPGSYWDVWVYKDY